MVDFSRAEDSEDSTEGICIPTTVRLLRNEKAITH